MPTLTVATGSKGRLPAWNAIPEIGQAVSGVGTYTQTFSAPEGWSSGTVAYLNLRTVTDTVQVTVNGHRVPVDQSNLSQIDIGEYLVNGSNDLAIRVSSRLYNAVKATGASGYGGAYEAYGLTGPVTLTPHRQVSLADATPPVSTTTAPVVTRQPASVTVVSGDLITLRANATANPAPTVQWQVSKNGGANWVDIPDATSTSYAFIGRAGNWGDLYRAVFTDTVGSIPTAVAKTTVKIVAKATVTLKRRSSSIPVERS